MPLLPLFEILPRNANLEYLLTEVIKRFQGALVLCVSRKWFGELF